MSERRNKRYSKTKDSDSKPVILAKRENPSSKYDKDKATTSAIKSNDQVQPKILLKPKENKDQQHQTQQQQQQQQQQVDTQPIGTQSASQSPSGVQVKEREIPHSTQMAIEEPVPIMTRPIILISSHNYQVNVNATKVLMKANTDFFVVGVLGMQNVGKSTIMNLLAAENCDKFRQQIISNDGGIFSTATRFKTMTNEMDNISKKYSSLPRTESIHMFITKDRMILLDCPPVLCNAYKRDATTNELDDMKLIILLLTTCHLLIVVQNDYFNLNLMRLLQFAELTKPNNDTKPFINDSYFPNVLFVKNKANRYDFVNHEKHRMEKMIKYFFSGSQLQIYTQPSNHSQNNQHQLTSVNGGADDKQKRLKNQLESDKRVNYFAFPEIKNDGLKPYHPNLETLFTEFRNRVFMSPRYQIYSGNTELTESSWLDLVTTTMLNKSHFFLTSYEETRRSHRDPKLEDETLN